jgi:3-oxoacyl-[acyl-carrier protein] reductase
MRAKYGRIDLGDPVVWYDMQRALANYAASRRAGRMSKAMAQDVASRGITVNCIVRGFITSPMDGKLCRCQK